MNIRMMEASFYSVKEGAGRPILNRIDTSFEAGTCSLIVGRTGSGKSSLLQALAGLLPLGQGSINYGGIALWKDSRRVDRGVMFDVGIAFQYPERQLFAETVRKEFDYSLRPLRWSKEEKLRAIHEALAQLNMPDDVLDHPVLTLSDGTKRKIALATTLAAKPRWLLLDEPTSGIDPSGIEPLLQIVRSHCMAGGGVIIASHDLDVFMPIADRVLILRNGAIAGDVTPKQCKESPELLLQSGVGLPAQIELSTALQRSGIVLDGSPLTPDAAAAAIIESLQSRRSPSNQALLKDEIPAVSRSTMELMEHDTTGNKNRDSLINRLDPLAKWIFYLCVSTGILVQHTWSGIMLASLLSFLLVIGSGASVRTAANRGVKFFLLFILVSTALSGLELGWHPFHAAFHTDPALLTLRQLLRFLLVMALGAAFMSGTNVHRMQRSLELVLSRLERFRFPAKMVTFSTALMLRFISLLNQEVERLSIITKSRGKADVKAGTIRLRDARVFLIPLLLSMMKHAEDTAFALEARGYKVRSTAHLQGQRLLLQHRDKLIIALGVMLLVVFLIADSYIK